MRRVKKDPMASARRWWTLTSRAVVSHLDQMNCPCKTADRSSKMSQFLHFCSWILRHHIHSGSRRQTLGQSTTDKDRLGSFFSIIEKRLSIHMHAILERLGLHYREAVPHWLRLHLGSRPEATASTHEAEQGDGGGDGGHAEWAIPGVQEAVLYRLPAPQEVRDAQANRLFSCAETFLSWNTSQESTKLFL